MDDPWEPVILKRRAPAPKQVSVAPAVARERKIDNNEKIVVKKVDSETLRALIKARIDKKLKQDNADNLCGFKVHTFRELEAGRHLPTNRELATIQRAFGIALKFV